MGTRSIQQIFCFEDDAGIVTAELSIKPNEDGVLMPVGAEVNYHSRTLMEGAEYHDFCRRTDGPCWGITEYREDIPEENKIGFSKGENIPVDQALKAMEAIFEWMENLYHDKFRKMQ